MTVFIQYDTPKKSNAGGSSRTWGCRQASRQKAKAIFNALETATPTAEGADVTLTVR